MTLREWLAALFKPKPQPAPLPKPVVTLAASKPEFTLGESVTIRWAITGADSARARQDNQTWIVLPKSSMSGSTTLRPTQDTKYTIDATNPSGTTTTMLSLLMRAPIGGGVPAPSISLSVPQSNVSGDDGTTIDMPITLTRVSNTTTVALSVAGLPTGVTGSFSDSSLTTGETTSTLTLTIAAGTAITPADAFTITGSAAGLSDAVINATVAVTHSAPPSDFTPNLPGGVGLVQRLDTVLTAAQVPENTVGGGSTGFMYGNWGSSVSGGRNITGVTGAPYATTALEVFYPGNDAGNGTGGCWLNDSGAGPSGHQYSRDYTAFAIWFSSDYVMHSGGEKWVYGYVTSAGAPTTYNPSLIQFECNNGETPAGTSFGIHVMPNLNLSSNAYTNLAAFGGTYFWISPDAINNRLTKGTWHQIEIYRVINTVNTANGVLKIWINGNLMFDRSNVIYSQDGSQGRFDGLRLDGTRGGGASTVLTPAGGQVRRINRLAYWAV